MARIDHTGHTHPATPAGRAACRNSLAKGVTPGPEGPLTAAASASVDRVVAAIATAFANRCSIDAKHCEHCGSTDPENVDFVEDGYTACCNELVAWTKGDCRNHHGN